MAKLHDIYKQEVIESLNRKIWLQDSHASPSDCENNP